MPDPSTPRWLTDEQQCVWRRYLAGTAAIERHLDQALRPFDLGLSEYEILVTLSESPQRRCRMSELAEAVRQSRSRLTHTVARLEKKQLIERLSCPDDKRGVIAYLTPSGLTLLKEAAPAHVESVRDVLVDHIDDDDFAALGRVMQQVIDHADQ